MFIVRNVNKKDYVGFQGLFCALIDRDSGDSEGIQEERV